MPRNVTSFIQETEQIHLLYVLSQVLFIHRTVLFQTILIKQRLKVWAELATSTVLFCFVISDQLQLNGTLKLGGGEVLGVAPWPAIPMYWEECIIRWNQTRSTSSGTRSRYRLSAYGTDLAPSACSMDLCFPDACFILNWHTLAARQVIWSNADRKINPAKDSFPTENFYTQLWNTIT